MYCLLNSNKQTNYKIQLQCVIQDKLILGQNPVRDKIQKKKKILTNFFFQQKIFSNEFFFFLQKKFYFQRKFDNFFLKDFFSQNYF